MPYSQMEASSGAVVEGPGRASSFCLEPSVVQSPAPGAFLGAPAGAPHLEGDLASLVRTHWTPAS